MRRDLGRDVFVALLLIADVDETMVDTHLQLRRRLIPAALVFIELFQALQRYYNQCYNMISAFEEYTY